jgi:hypothetical protein
LTSCFVKAYTVWRKKLHQVGWKRASYQSDCPYKGVPSKR